MRRIIFWLTMPVLCLLSNSLLGQGNAPNVGFGRQTPVGFPIAGQMYEFVMAGMPPVNETSAPPIVYANDILAIFGVPLEVTSGSSGMVISRCVPGPFSGKIFPAIGASDPIPDHEFACLHFGEIYDWDPFGGVAWVDSWTRGLIRADYSTNAPSMYTAGVDFGPGTGNEFATLEAHSVFVAFGSPVEALQPTAQDPIPNTIDMQFFQFGTFRQRIDVGETSLTLAHLGGGLFITAGVASVSNENSIETTLPTVDYLKLDVGGVDNEIITYQKIPIDSSGVSVLPVRVLQSSALFAGIPPQVVGDDPPNPLPENFLWSFVTKCFFEGEDQFNPDVPGPTTGVNVTTLSGLWGGGTGGGGTGGGGTGGGGTGGGGTGGGGTGGGGVQ